MAGFGSSQAARSRTASGRTDFDRELKEALGILVSEACLAPLTFASHAYPDFHLLMRSMSAALGGNWSPRRKGSSWLGEPNRLRDYEMPPADVPLVSHLMALL